jgi:hypothetical protein
MTHISINVYVRNSIVRSRASQSDGSPSDTSIDRSLDFSVVMQKSDDDL